MSKPPTPIPCGLQGRWEGAWMLRKLQEQAGALQVGGSPVYGVGYQPGASV